MIRLAMWLVIRELSRDRGVHSWYYTWKSNIAMCIMDKCSNVTHQEANDAAIMFLDLLVGAKKGMRT